MDARAFRAVAAVLPLIMLAMAWGVADRVGGPAAPEFQRAYVPVVGDVLFQSSRHHELVDAIEGVTGSPLSHCGVVAVHEGQWVVIEALQTVTRTPLAQWIERGRDGRMAAYRLDRRYQGAIDTFIQRCEDYLGRPYDARFTLDDEFIYCSELVYKAFPAATGESLGRLVRLGDLDWQPWEDTIRRYEGGQPPLNRLMITPRDLANATQLTLVYDNGLIHPTPESTQ